MNNVVLIGRMTKDAQLAYTASQKAVAKFTLAIDRIGEGADFIPCVAFGKQAENIEKYVKKGNKIAISGRIQTGSYEKEDGTKVYTTDVIVGSAEFIEPKKESSSKESPSVENEPKPAEASDRMPDDDIDFDIPF